VRGAVCPAGEVQPRALEIGRWESRQAKVPDHHARRPRAATRGQKKAHNYQTDSRSHTAILPRPMVGQYARQPAVRDKESNADRQIWRAGTFLSTGVSRGNTVGNMGDVVLVHGAFIDSSCWDSVARELRERGHRVAAVDLHQGTLAADTLVVQQAVDSFGGEVVACGWSYGGMVITGLAVPPGSHLVYLCSFMPDEGECMSALLDGHTDLDRVLQVDDSGDFLLAGEEVDEIVWADADAELRVTARASLRIQATQSTLDTPARVSWRDVPSTFVIGTRDRCIHVDFQREMAQRASEVVEWDTSHSPPLSRPDLVVHLLDRLATR